MIDEGPRIYIERINIIGNLRTRDYVVRREFRLAEGDAYNPLMVDKAKKRLQQLGFFKTVEIKRRPGSAPDRVILDVELVEQSTGELSFGAGYSTSEGVIGDVSHLRAQPARARAVPAPAPGRLAGAHADRSELHRAALPRPQSRRRLRPVPQGRQPLEPRPRSAPGRPAARCALGFPITENLWLTNSYTLTTSEIYDVQPRASRAIKEAQGDAITSSWGTSLAYDARNHPKNPTERLLPARRAPSLRASAATCSTGAPAPKVATTIRSPRRSPSSARAMGGHIEGWGGQDVRLIDLFYKGGETIRGFNRGGFGPRDLLTSDALGGDTFWSATAEVRFPFPFIPEELGMSGAVFVDAGSLFGAGAGAKKLDGHCGEAAHGQSGQRHYSFNGVCLADSSAVRASAGVSIIWNSPLGPLRLDIAKALKKESYDDEQLIRFGASTRF